MDIRLKEINSRLIEYSTGHFTRRIKISDKKDELDAVSIGINMLGEELNDATISKIYFNSIFNSLSEMVFIINKKGIIQDVNKAGQNKLQYSKKELTGKNIYRFYQKDFVDNKNIPSINNSVSQHHGLLTIKKGNNIPVRVKSTRFRNSLNKELLVLTVTDISNELKGQNNIMQAIIQGEEIERERLSKDLHDSLIQQLAAAKFHINSTLSTVRSKKMKSSLNVPNKILSNLIQEVRTICFNLMPDALQEFGLQKAISAFASRYNTATKLEIVNKCPLPEISRELQLQLFRISQEFISNAIKHGRAEKIKIRFSFENQLLQIIFTDNGKGFNIKRRFKGMGLRNIQGRIKSYNGATKIDSQPGKGTSIKILIPINNQLWPGFQL
jgi:PAS domain S-box-containing protein